jgi:hypothetical protein
VVNLFADSAGIDANKVPYQLWYIFRSLAERRHHERKYIETVIEIASELPAFHHLRQIAMCGCYQPNVNLMRVGAAEAFKLSLLENPQQLGLQGERKIADFIKEERPSVSRLEPSEPLRESTSEGSLFMAKEFAFQKICRDRSAIQLYKRAPTPVAQVVNGAGN